VQVAGPPAFVSRRDARVLVVEDGVLNKRIAKLQLGRLGCHVDVASGGFEALERLWYARYELILMDCDRQRCTAAGMVDYLSKPVDAILLRETLQRWLPPDLVNLIDVSVR